MDIPVGWLTEGLERAGDWMGGLTAELVGVKKMVEMTVTVTGSLAAGFVACGVPFEVEERERPPPVNPVGWGGFVAVSSTGRVEEGLTDGTEEEQMGETEDGSTVAEGSTPVDVPGMALERVMFGSSNLASLRARSEYPSSTIARAHQVPTSTCQPV